MVELDGIGERLREERTRAGLSQRELARRLGVSASLVSQLESGHSNPSVGTLYSIVTELDLSLDRFLRGDNYVGHVEQPDQSRGGPAPVLAKSERKVINLASGVRWEQMCDPDSGVDFLHTVYDVGGASTPDESLMRHHGYEYGYVISGTLGVQLEFDEHILGPGDAISFDSNQPHRLYNLGDEPVNAVWFVVGRGADDRVNGE